MVTKESGWIILTGLLNSFLSFGEFAMTNGENYAI